MSKTFEYPIRPPFFIAKFARALAKACVANEHGPDVAWLLTVVASTEDSKGYRGPVNFWNGQLMPLIGARSIDKLKRVRSRAVESGWLDYRPGRKNVPPFYYVKVPEIYQDLNDSPVDENPNEFKAVEPPPIETSSEVILKFPCKGQPDHWNLLQPMIDNWKEIYPKLDILDECKRALAWIKGKGPRSAMDMPLFIVRWLNKSLRSKEQPVQTQQPKPKARHYDPMPGETS